MSSNTVKHDPACFSFQFDMYIVHVIKGVHTDRRKELHFVLPLQFPTF